MALTRTPSSELTPGTRLRWTGPRTQGVGNVAILERRKQHTDNHHGLPFHPGWWVEGGGGLADFVIDAEDSNWEVIK